MKTLLYLKFVLLLLLGLPQVANSQFTNPDLDTKWNIGFNMGGVWQDGDIQLDRPGFGYGFTLGRAIYENPSEFWSLDARFRYMKGFTYGQNLTKLNSENIPDNSIYSSDSTNYKSVFGYTYLNNRTMIHDFSLEAVLNFHALREKTGVLLSVFGGIGVTDYKTTTNLLNSNNFNKMYDYSLLDESSITKNDFRNLQDDYYETRALYNESSANTVRFMPSLGIALGYQITPKWSFGFEHKVTFALHDEFEGYKNEGTQFLKWGNNDKYHFTSVFFRLNIFKGEESSDPIYSEDCLTPYLKIADIPNNYVVNEQMVSIKARVSRISSNSDVILVANDQMVQTSYDQNTDYVGGTVMLVEGENKILFIASNSCGDAMDSVVVIYNPSFCPKPVISIETPEATSSAKKVELKALVLQLQSGSLQVKLNNSVVPHQFDANSQLLTANLELNVGNNLVAIQAINKCGDTSVFHTVEYRCVSPTVSISTPVNGVKYETQSNQRSFAATTENISEASQIQMLFNREVANFSFNKTNNSVSGNLLMREGSNSISIRVTNDCGTQTKTVQFEYEKPCLLPVVSISSPANNQNVTTSQVIISGNVTNIAYNSNVQVRLNGVLVNSNYSNGTFSTGVNLKLGANVVEVFGTNECGTDSEKLYLTYSCSKPIVNISYPSNGTNLNSSNVTLNGSVSNVSAKSQINITVNGSSVPFSYNFSSGTFTSSIILSSGQNVIRVMANTDCGSDSKTTSVYVNEACPDPLVAISYPYSGSSFNTSTINLTGTASNVSYQSQIRITLNGVNQSFSFNTSSKAYSASLNLNSGNNSIVVTATTNCGTDTRSINVTYNAPCQLPVVTISSPQNGSNLANSFVTLSGSVLNVSYQSQIRVLLNGVNQSFSYNTSSRTLGASLNLRTGSNTIMVSATTECGTDSESITVSYNEVCPSPVVNISSPQNGSSVTNSLVTLTGSVINISNQSEMSVKVNGVSKSFSYNLYNKTYSANLNLTAGNNTIVVSANTSCGYSSKTLNVVYNKSCPAPVVSISSPRDGLNLSSSTTAFVGLVQNITSSSQVSLLVNGVAINKSFNATTKIVSATLNLKQGANTVELVGTNSCGVDRKTITVSYKCPLATVNIASPNTGMRYTTNSILFSGFVSGVSDKNQLQLTLNGTQIPFTYTAATSKFEGNMTLVEGSNTLIATVTNQCGTVTKSTTVSYTKPCPVPTVIITSPSNNASVSGSSITISGVAANLNTQADMQLKVNGVNTSFTYNSSSKTFTANATLVEGNNSILATVATNCGSDSKTINVVYTKPCPKPTVNITSPSNNASVSGSSITISGVAVSLNTQADMQLKVNGVNTTFTYNSSSKTFTAKATLVEGNNSILATVATNCGSDSKTINVVYTKPCPKPTVTILNPKNGGSVSDQLITINGVTSNITSESQIKLTINGVSIPFIFNVSAQSFSASHDLNEGNNVIAVTVTNSCGNEAKSVSVGYTRPCPKPTLSITSPINGSTNTSGIVTISGSATNITGNSQMSIKVNGVSSTLTYSAETNKFLTKADLKSGSNIIVIVATNSCGSVTKTINVSYVPPCPTPTVIVSSPSSANSSVLGNKVLISGVAANLVSKSDMQIRVNGAVQSFNYSGTSGAYSASLTLNEGVNSINVDVATNCGADSKTIKVTSVLEKPIIRVVTPSADTSNFSGSQYKLVGTVEKISSQSQFSIYVNGGKIKTYNFSKIATENYSFNGLIELKNGKNVIVLKAVHSSGSEEVVTKVINLLNVVPTPSGKGKVEQELGSPSPVKR